MGFDIGYRGLLCRCSYSNNIPIMVGLESEIWAKLMKEVHAGRHAGPYKTIPYKYYIQSPVGLVPKSGGQTRLIFHLSYDFGEEWEQRSLNYHTPDEMCTVKYNDLDFAARAMLELLADGETDTNMEEMSCDNNEESLILPDGSRVQGGKRTILWQNQI